MNAAKGKYNIYIFNVIKSWKKMHILQKSEREREKEPKLNVTKIGRLSKKENDVRPCIEKPKLKILIER